MIRPFEALLLMLYSTRNLKCADMGAATDSAYELGLLHSSVVLYSGYQPVQVDVILRDLDHGGSFPVAILALSRLDDETLLTLGLDRKDPKRHVFWDPDRADSATAILMAEHAEAALPINTISRPVAEALRSYIGTLPAGVIVLREEPDSAFFLACAKFLPCLESADQ